MLLHRLLRAMQRIAYLLLQLLLLLLCCSSCLVRR